MLTIWTGDTKELIGLSQENLRISKEVMATFEKGCQDLVEPLIIGNLEAQKWD